MRIDHNQPRDFRNSFHNNTAQEASRTNRASIRRKIILIIKRILEFIKRVMRLFWAIILSIAYSNFVKTPDYWAFMRVSFIIVSYGYMEAFFKDAERMLEFYATFDDVEVSDDPEESDDDVPSEEWTPKKPRRGKKSNQ